MGKERQQMKAYRWNLPEAEKRQTQEDVVVWIARRHEEEKHSGEPTGG